MPTTHAAKKSLRQSVKHKAANRVVKSAVRTWVRRVERAIEFGNAQQARDDARWAMKKLQKAGRKGVLHPNKVARDQSRLARALNAMGQKSTS
ncbi:MAG: 30S ribosomal protein S20 [Planctomycetes bacterium]|nr:30S ribosomal protein S20 [Planctomycetota bacterium]